MLLAGGIKLDQVIPLHPFEVRSVVFRNVQTHAQKSCFVRVSLGGEVTLHGRTLLSACIERPEKLTELVAEHLLPGLLQTDLGLHVALVALQRLQVHVRRFRV